MFFVLTLQGLEVGDQKIKLQFEMLNFRHAPNTLNRKDGELLNKTRFKELQTICDLKTSV